ncbi:MAG: ThiF family adenylyltransferase [Euryarchaeota archaeon]|nr:ThiF family adenylyltransferase [Euryarchaeota archaeon]
MARRRLKGSGGARAAAGRLPRPSGGGRAGPAAPGRAPAAGPPVLRAGHVDADRFERSKRVGWFDFERIRKERVLVVGAGALGNEVVKNLVLSGYRRISLVDMDRVVYSNLNRCVFFSEEDSRRKRLKAEVVASKAGLLDREARIVPYDHRIEELPDGFFGDHDLVLGCLDNIAARLHINARTYPRLIPYVDGATLGTVGKVQVVLPPETPCLECGMNRTHMKVLEKRWSCTGRDVTFFDPKLAAEITTTSVIAAVQVREALKLTSRRHESCIRHMFYYDATRNVCDVLQVDLNPRCPHHGAPEAVE